MPEDVHWKQYGSRFRTHPKLIDIPPDPQTKLIVCMPVLAEEQLLSTLTSLWTSRSSEHYTEVILLFNTNKFMTDHELQLHEFIRERTGLWCDDHKDTGMRFFQVSADPLPGEKGGVGWARKRVMDEAARRLAPDGILICLDGDCLVRDNYIDAIASAFAANGSFNAASIYFEHNFDNLSPDERSAIIIYELHLRYLVQAQRWTGHPFAYHTVGSAMAVRRNAYLAQGGMNTRSAGEDFYFLQKFIETESLFRINSTTVYPSARVSQRVPFGTGRAMDEMIHKGVKWQTTNFESFRLLRSFFKKLDEIYPVIEASTTLDKLEPFIRMEERSFILFLEKIDFVEKLKEIKRHTTSIESFRKRFFRFFNAFQMIRYMHFMRDHAFHDTEVTDAVNAFLHANEIYAPAEDAESYLSIMRELDRQ